MKHNWIRRAATGALAALLLAAPASAATVQVNGKSLPAEEGWVEDGTSYLTLKALSRETGSTLTWDGTTARLKGRDLTLTASPGACCVEVNGRALYVPGGVRVVDGHACLPLRLLASALGGQADWDGQRGVAALTWRASRIPKADYDREDLYWLSRIISAESRGEPLLGQIAVGNVVLNRVASPQYPDSIKDVIFDFQGTWQFEPVENGSVFLEPTASSVLAAKAALEGAQVVGECLYFFAPALSEGTWIVENCTYYETIGCHRFYF